MQGQKENQKYPSLSIDQNSLNNPTGISEEQWSLPQKQQFLFKQIIEAEYDPQEFQEYLESQKGLDLNQWAKGELIKAVRAFKNRQSSDQSLQSSRKQQRIQEQQIKHKKQEHKLERNDKQQDILRIQSYLEKQQTLQSQYLKKRVIPSTISQGNNLINNTSLYRFYTIKKKKQSQLWIQASKGSIKKIGGQKVLSITVPKAHKSSTTLILFTTYHIQYEIRTKSQNIDWKVVRRFNQFKWLYESLKQMYPYLPIPPIPLKTTMRSFDQAHIDQRRAMFEKFLNKLIQCPQLCSQSIVQDFLQISSIEQFKKAKQGYQKYLQLSKGSRNEQIQTIHAQEQFEPSKITITDQCFQNYKGINDLYMKLVAKTAQIDISNQSLLKEYTELSDLFAKLQQKQREFKGNSLHSLVIQYISQLRNWTVMSNNIIGKYIKDTYSYEQKYIEQYLCQMRKIRKHNDNISDRFKQVFFKYSDGQIPVLDPAENSKLAQSAKFFRQFQRQKQDYKIGLSNLLRQVQRYYEKGDMLKSHIQIWNNALKIYMQGIRQGMMGGVDLLTKILSMKQGKQLLEVQYKPEYNKSSKKQEDTSVYIELQTNSFDQRE